MRARDLLSAPFIRPPAQAEPAPPETSPARPFDPEIVRELATLMADTDLTEIEVEKGDLRIRVARTVQAAPAVQMMMPASAMAAAPTMPAALAGDPVPSEAELKHSDALTSPMVGTAYRRASPEAKPFVEIGSQVRAGERLLLIEAMKTFNDIVAPRAGTVRAIYVEDGQPVEYGEPLIVID